MYTVNGTEWPYMCCADVPLSNYSLTHSPLREARENFGAQTRPTYWVVAEEAQISHVRYTTATLKLVGVELLNLAQ